MKTKTQSKFNTIAIMSTFVFGCGAMVVNPIIQKLIEAYPDVPVPTIKMVSTLVALISSVVMIIVGGLVGKQLKYKTVMLLAMVCFLVGGLLPIVWNASFYFILIARSIFGIGMGLIGCRNGLVINTFGEAEKAKLLGYGIFVSNGCGVLMQTLCGYLADIDLKLSYTIYLVAVIPLLLILFGMKEPESSSSLNTVATMPQEEKMSIKPKVWLYIGIGFLWCVIGYSMMTNMASFVKMKELGQAGTSGMLLSMYMLAGAFGGIVSGKWLRRCKRYFVPMTMAMAAIGECLVLIGSNVAIIAVGAALAGFPWFALNPNLMYFSGIVSGKRSASLATSIVLAATQAGVFLSSYWCMSIGKIFPSTNVIIATKYSAIIGFALMAVIFLVFDIRPDQLKEKN